MLQSEVVSLTHLILLKFVLLMLPAFCFTLFSADVCISFFDKFEQYEMLFEDCVPAGG